jgi:anti-sigma B factor antagonist
MTDRQALTLRLDVTAGPTAVVEGEIDLATASQFRDALLSELVRGGGSLHLNLSGVEFMDTAGIHVLLATRRRAALMGGHVCVVAFSHPVSRICELAGVSRDLLASACASEEAL